MHERRIKLWWWSFKIIKSRLFERKFIIIFRVHINFKLLSYFVIMLPHTWFDRGRKLCFILNEITCSLKQAWVPWQIRKINVAECVTEEKALWSNFLYNVCLIYLSVLYRSFIYVDDFWSLKVYLLWVYCDDTFSYFQWTAQVGKFITFHKKLKAWTMDFFMQPTWLNWERLILTTHSIICCKAVSSHSPSIKLFATYAEESKRCEELKFGYTGDGEERSVA